VIVTFILRKCCCTFGQEHPRRLFDAA